MSDDTNTVSTPIEQPSDDDINQFPQMPVDLPVVEDNTVEEEK